MASSNVQYVVVWELSRQHGRWTCYSPQVSQILEKAYRSRLTQVLLGDADPSLSKYRFVCLLWFPILICLLKNFFVYLQDQLDVDGANM